MFSMGNLENSGKLKDGIKHRPHPPPRQKKNSKNKTKQNKILFNFLPSSLNLYFHFGVIFSSLCGA